MKLLLIALAVTGWGAAFVFRGVLGVSRRRVTKAREELACARYDVRFATEELAKAFDDLNVTRDELLRVQGRLRAYELADSERRKARAN